jgi:NAD(P)H-flavin reductase
LVLVAGGVGVAPFPLFLSRIVEYGAAAALPADVIALAGFRDASQARAVAPLERAVADYAESGRSCRLVVATEDGSLGSPGKVTDLLREELRPGDKVAVCGPAGMSEAVWQVCSLVQDVRVWLSLEAGMACGVGSCHGCVITLSDGSFARVCHEGPVFAGEMIFGRPEERPDLRKEPV